MRPAVSKTRGVTRHGDGRHGRWNAEAVPVDANAEAVLEEGTAVVDRQIIANPIEVPT